MTGSSTDIKSGRLKASKVGRSYCIRQVKLDDFLEQLENKEVQASLQYGSEQKCQKTTEFISETTFGTWISEHQAANALDDLLAQKTNKSPIIAFQIRA